MSDKNEYELEQTLKEAYRDVKVPDALRIDTLSLMQQAARAQGAQEAREMSGAKDENPLPTAATPPVVPDTVIPFPTETTTPHAAASATRRHTSPKRRTRPKGRGFTAGIAAACLAVVLLCTGGYLGYTTETAYASIDMDSSIELKLNRFNRVIGAASPETTGQDALDAVQVVGMTYDEAVEALIAQDGGLSDSDSIAYVTVCATSERQQKNLSERSLSHFESIGHTAQCNEVSAETREAAAANDISVGKYLAYLTLQELGVDISIEECRAMTRQDLDAFIVANGGDTSELTGAQGCQSSGGGGGEHAGSATGSDAHAGSGSASGNGMQHREGAL